MPTLTPKQASVIADGVYALQDQSVSEVTKRGDVSLGTEGLFNVTDGSRFEGSSGALLYRKLSGFGYIAEGVGNFQGHVLCATRGTAMLADWLTDGSVGMESGPTGSQVHIGFNTTWNSYSDALRAYLRNKNPTHIHCVGHSLGGALAMLNADYFTNLKIPASVYTFGAPRVGGSTFSDALSKRIIERGGKIHRVSHVADPVPMIPTFPFYHAPYAAKSFWIGTGLFSFGAHSMTNSYVPGVATYGWGSLPQDPQQLSDEKIQAWLDKANTAGGVKMYSAHALYMIGAALKWLLRKIGNALGGIITAGTAYFTLIDRVAWMISKGVEITAEVSMYALSLVGAVLRWLGRVATAAYDMTMAYLRWVFGMLFQTMATAANMALYTAKRRG